ncbi:hypothetical protein HF086_002586 [Spodoptera exigua]|uniref:Uncharacterized protein n=1 Tax=Spodoptera exigua TaxID=7107 RepID=A0A922MHW3_SPOEX|nr:hypothetical protein HF086_002586 [Spodoptera exigua]
MNVLYFLFLAGPGKTCIPGNPGGISTCSPLRGVRVCCGRIWLIVVAYGAKVDSGATNMASLLQLQPRSVFRKNKTQRSGSNSLIKNLFK